MKRTPARLAIHVRVPDFRIVHPSPAIAFFEHIFERGERDGQKREAQHVEFAQKGRIGVIDATQEGNRAGDDRAGDDIDEEKPMPRIGLGDPAAKRGAR